MRIKLSLAGALLCAMATLPACGPEQTSADKDDQQVAELVKREKAKFAPLTGQYIGTVTNGNGTSFEIGLNVIPNSQPQANSSRFQVTDVPTVGGGIYICLKAGDDCFSAEKFQDKKNKLLFGIFTSASYDPKTGSLSFFSTAGGTSGLPSLGGGGGVTAALAMDGSFKGTVIEGNIYASTGPLGYVKVKKIR